MTASDDPIEQYLDDLLTRAPGGPREVRTTLAEAEAHLRDAERDARGRGLSAHDAAVDAVRRMGAPDAAVDHPSLLPWGTRSLRRRLVLGALLVTAAGGLAVGLAGLLARLAVAVWGPRVVGIPFPTGAYTASDCARWLALYPDAGSCRAAMVQDHANDFLAGTALAGLLGLVAAVAYALLRRRWGTRAVAVALPGGVEQLVGAVLAALVAVGVLAQLLDTLSAQGSRAYGLAQSVALAVAALVAAVALALWGRRAHRRPLLAHPGGLGG